MCANTSQHVKAGLAVISRDTPHIVWHRAAMDTDWFKSRMKRLKVSQEALATAIRRDRSAVSRIINGQQSLEQWHVGEFARLLECSPEEILRRAGFPISGPGDQAVAEEAVPTERPPPPPAPMDDEIAFAMAEVLAGMTGLTGFPKLPRGRLAQLVKAQALALADASDDPDERRRLLDFALTFMAIYFRHSSEV